MSVSAEVALTDVAVAVIMKPDGSFLMAQRPAGKPYAGYWEFPGGKVEADEDPKAALARELHEELAIRAKIEEEIVRYEYQYPGRPPMLLMFFRVTEWTPEPENVIFESMIWETATRFRNYDFLDGDIDFVRRLARGEY